MKALPWLIIILTIIAGIFLAADQANQSATQRAYAQAAVIQAQSAARLDSTAAFLPYLVLGVGVAFAGAIVVLSAVIYIKSPPPQPQRILERQIIIMIAPPGHQSRAEMWRELRERRELAHATLSRQNPNH